MLSPREQRILSQIERGLHQDDPRFGRQLTAVRTGGLAHHRGARVCLVIELILLALATVGTALRLPTPLVLGAGIGVLLAAAVLACRLEPPGPSDRPPTPWYG